MKVLNAQVLLEIEKEEAPIEKIGMLEVPVGMNKEWEKGKVISFGNQVIGVEEGDKVLIYPGAGKTIKVDGKEYRVISSAEIIVVL